MHASISALTQMDRELIFKYSFYQDRNKGGARDELGKRVGTAGE